MTLAALESLAESGLLKREPPDALEIQRMLAAARRGLADAQVAGLSINGRFAFLYLAAHTLALAALRWHGYRSEKRYLVFQCLAHTVMLAPAQCRLFDNCHRQRNLAEYEGYLDIAPGLVHELAVATEELHRLVVQLVACSPEQG